MKQNKHWWRISDLRWWGPSSLSEKRSKQNKNQWIKKQNNIQQNKNWLRPSGLS